MCVQKQRNCFQQRLISFKIMPPTPSISIFLAARRCTMGEKLGGEKKKKSRDGPIIGGLTILPRLNSLNQDPGISLGHEDILTCGQQNALITYNHRTLKYRTKGHCLKISNWQKIKSFFLFLLHFKYFFRRSPLVVFLQLCLHSKY